VKSLKRLGLILPLLLAGALGLAQNASHQLEARIPNYIGLKIVDDLGLIALDAGVDFDYSTDLAGYNAAVAGPGRLQPTSVNRFADVQVVVRRGWWAVYVRATPLGYSGSRSGAGLALGDIRVTPGSASGLTPDAISNRGTLRSSWNLRTNWRWIAFDRRPTRTWKSLGFNGLDYTVDVQGDEDPGSYQTTVTYLLVNP